MLSDWFLSEYYHIHRKNPSSFSINVIALTSITEQSHSTLDKFRMEVIYVAPGFIHILGIEHYLSGFYERNINSLIQHQNAPNSIMFGTDTT